MSDLTYTHGEKRSEQRDGQQKDNALKAAAAAAMASAAEEAAPTTELLTAGAPDSEASEADALDPTLLRPAAGGEEAPAPSPSSEATVPARPATGPQGTSVAPIPVERAGKTASAESNEPQVSSVKRFFAKVRERAFAHKITAAACCAVAVAAVALLAFAAANAASVPSADVVAADARTRVVAPEYDGGKWGVASSLQVSDVKVDSVRRSATAPEADAAQFGAAGYATAEVTVTYEGAAVHVTKTATLGFARIADAWTAAGTEANANATFEATAGVDEHKVVENARDILVYAESTLHEGNADDGVGEMSLAGLYGTGTITVTDSTFDEEAQTDVVSLHCESAGTFDARSCDITVTFSFRPVNGLWEITQTEVSQNPKARSFAPLLGT